MAAVAVDSLSASGANTGFKAIPGIVKDKVVGVAKNASKIGKDDPRKVMHCGKVGLALTLNSLFYYYNPLYDGFGQSGIWAVLTVVVVFEFTVGGTLSKSLNRGFATFSAASLGFGVVYLAQLSGRVDEQAMVIGVVVFILAALSTFTRFFPRIKRKYDYGMVVFILTFSMVAVSGYRAEKIMVMSYQRLLTVVIGATTCIIISILVCPAWAGEDLQNLIAGNIEKLAKSLEGFGNAYFCFPEEDDESGVVTKDDKEYDHQHYKSVLNSKTSEESLATFAWWEIGHGEFRFRHPWKQYLKVGDLARECASHIHALSAYLTSENQAPIEFVKRIKEPCMAMCSESSKALRELSSTIKTMTHPSPAMQTHLQTSKAAIADLRAALQSSPAGDADADLFSIIPVLAVVSILTDIAACVDNISESTEELSVKARFKKPSSKADNNSSSAAAPPPPELQLLHRGTVNPVAEDEGGYVAVTISGTSQDSPGIGNSNPPENETKISKSSEANIVNNKT